MASRNAIGFRVSVSHLWSRRPPQGRLHHDDDVGCGDDDDDDDGDGCEMMMMMVVVVVVASGAVYLYCSR